MESKKEICVKKIRLKTIWKLTNLSYLTPVFEMFILEFDDTLAIILTIFRDLLNAQHQRTECKLRVYGVGHLQMLINHLENDHRRRRMIILLRAIVIGQRIQKPILLFRFHRFRHPIFVVLFHDLDWEIVLK